MDDVPLSKPDITDREIELVTQVLRSDRLSIGPMVERFERMLAARCNRQHGVACSSGTAGLHMALIAAGVGPGDEVVTTPFSFIAPANSILYVGAKPVFAEICPKSLNMDPAKLEAVREGREETAPGTKELFATFTPWLTVIGVLTLFTGGAPEWVSIAFIVVGVVLTKVLSDEDGKKPAAAA